MAEWKEHQLGSGSTLRVGRVAITVSYSLSGPSGYVVGVGMAEARLKNHISDAGAAQEAGIRLARKILTEALAALPPEVK